MKIKLKAKNKKFQNQMIDLIRAELVEVDMLLDDYFEAELNECGMKWFSFNEEKTKNPSELVRVSVWSLDGNCLNVEEMLMGKYIWLGDLVASIDNNGILKYIAEENKPGIIADEIRQLFARFCGGLVAGKMAEVVEVRVNMKVI